jgi:hypothetical protein
MNLTKEEIDAIIKILENVPVKNLESAKALIKIVEKLTKLNNESIK